jgi:hypothetical protein
MKSSNTQDLPLPWLKQSSATTRAKPGKSAAGKSTKAPLGSLDYSRMSHTQKLERALETMRAVTASVRPRGSSGEPGGLVTFTSEDRREFIIVGDLHANSRNLKAVLRSGSNLRKLLNNKAVLILLGDIVHDERTGHLMEMDSSIRILDIVIHLINKVGRNVVYLAGNHDTFDKQLAKSGIRQGEVLKQEVTKRRGRQYAELLDRFFTSLPVLVRHPHFIAVHAGPVRGGIGRSELINIDHYPECRHQLIWNRINETRSTPSQKEYAPQDLKDMRSALKSDPKTPVIVGHNPLWQWGGEDSIWINPMQVENYVILYSGAAKVCPYLVFKGSRKYSVKYADLRLPKKRFVLD